MNRIIIFAGNILAEIINYILIVCIQVLLFLDFLKQWPGSLRVAGLVLIPVFYYLVREFCNNAVLFFLLHVLVPVAVITLYGRVTSEKIVFGMLVLVLTFISITRKLFGKSAGTEVVFPPAAAGICFAVYLADGLQAKGACGTYLMQLMIIYMLLFFLYFYLMQFMQYMDVNNRTTEHIPVNRAFYTSAGLMAGFIGISAMVITFLADRQLADRVALIIGNALRTVLAFLFSFRGESEEMAYSTVGGVADSNMLPLPVEDGGISLLAQILDALLLVMGLIVTAVLLAAVIIGFVRLVRNVFGRMGQGKEKENIGERDMVESLILPKRRKKEMGKKPVFIFSGMPSQTIRRQFVKTLVRKYRMMKEEKTEKLIQSGTARECCISLFPCNPEEAEEFAILYEKARYSREICDRADVKQMKILSAKLLK